VTTSAPADPGAGDAVDRPRPPEPPVELYGTANWARWAFGTPLFVWALIGLLVVGGVNPGPPFGWSEPLVMAGAGTVLWTGGYFLGVPDRVVVGPDFFRRRARMRWHTVRAHEVRSIYLVGRFGGGDNLVIDWGRGKVRISVPYVKGRGEDKLAALTHFVGHAKGASALKQAAASGALYRKRGVLPYVIVVTAVLYALVGLMRILVG
jgi:hypothetical protein